MIVQGRVIQNRHVNTHAAYVVDMGRGYSVMATDNSKQRRKHGEVVSVRLSDKQAPVIM